jgi:hypothetical protein
MRGDIGGCEEAECGHHGNWYAVEKNKQLDQSRKENEELKDFTIWMTGCGYDFCQHEYFKEQRNKLLKKCFEKEKNDDTDN